MASQPPLEPASAPPPSSLASFLESHDTWLTGGGTHLRRIVPERLESKYACTVNWLQYSTAPLGRARRRGRPFGRPTDFRPAQTDFRPALEWERVMGVCARARDSETKSK